MKTKQLIWLIVLFVAVSSLVALKHLRQPKELATQEYAPLDFHVDPAQVASIDLIKPSGKEEQFVELRKEGTNWKLKSLSQARADGQKIDEFLKEIKSLQGEVRASSKDLFKDFGIGEDEGLHLILKDAAGKDLMNLVVGTNKPDARSTFVRQNNSNAVYLTPADIFGKLGIYGKPAEEKLDNQYWASSVLSDFNEDKIESIEVKHIENGKEFLRASVIRKASAADAAKKEWHYTREGLPFDLDAAKIKSFLTSFKTWRAQKVLDPKKDEDYGFGASKWMMTLKVEGSPAIEIRAGKEDTESKATYMKISNEPVIFLLSPYYYENMDVDDSRFFTDNPLGVDAAKLAKITVTTEKGKFEAAPKDKVWDSLTEYLNELKSFNVSRLIFNPEEAKKVKSPSKISLELLKVGQAQPMILDLGDVVKDSPKEYGILVRGTNQPFAVSEVFKMNAIDKAERLNAPPPPKTEPVPAVPASSTAAPVAKS